MKLTTYTKRIGAGAVSKFIASDTRAQQIDRALERWAEPVTDHGNCRAVIAGPIDEERYRVRIEKHGAKEITSSWFSSAWQASTHFGYDFNYVAQQLSAAKRRGESPAFVAGVPVQYADQIGGVN